MCYSLFLLLGHAEMIHRFSQDDFQIVDVLISELKFFVLFFTQHLPFTSPLKQKLIFFLFLNPGCSDFQDFAVRDPASFA